MSYQRSITCDSLSAKTINSAALSSVASFVMVNADVEGTPASSPGSAITDCRATLTQRGGNYILSTAIQGSVVSAGVGAQTLNISINVPSALASALAAIMSVTVGTQGAGVLAAAGVIYPAQMTVAYNPSTQRLGFNFTWVSPGAGTYAAYANLSIMRP